MFASPDAIHGLAAMLRRRADDVRGEGDRLLARSVELAWRGRAGDAMRVAVADLVGELRTAAALHEHAAGALDRHADAVEATLRAAREAAELAGDLAHDAEHLLGSVWRSVA
jgi:hypothetical protein